MAKRKIDRRENQRARTRKDLLQAAARLMRGGKIPTIDDVAEEALVSRATVYRYFQSIEALLVEAPLDKIIPGPDEVFVGDKTRDPFKRLDRAEAAMHKMVYRNESQMKILLVNALNMSSGAGNADSFPRRQNRRTPLIDAALEPSRDSFDKSSYEKLRAALALVFGIESMIVFRDVISIDEKRARRIKSWMIRQLVDSALKESRIKKS